MIKRGLAVVVAVTIFLEGGCATSLQKAAQTVATSLHVEADIEEAIIAADKAEKEGLEKAVGDGNMSARDAMAKDAAWEAKLYHVVAAVHAFKDALVVASHVVDAAASGGQGDYKDAVAQVAKAYATLVSALADVGIHVPGVV